jgi:hypothetical protein
VPSDTVYDVFSNWQSKYNYESQIKPLGQVNNQFISNLIDLEELIAYAKYDSALLLLNTMQPDHIYAENYITVFETILAARIPSVRKLTSNEINILTNIANQNTRIVGPSVFAARGILWSEEGINFQDQENDRPQGIGAQIIFDACYEQLPSDITAQLIDENDYVYSDIPIMINEDGCIYITSDYVASLSAEHSYKFKINYDNTNSGLLTLNQLFSVESNNYYLCNMGKTGSEKKKPTTHATQQPIITSIHIYPNPATRQINIDLPTGDKVYSIEIDNLIGQKVFSNNMSESANINTTTFENGVYIIKIMATNGELLKTERISILN